MIVRYYRYDIDTIDGYDRWIDKYERWIEDMIDR